MNWWLSGQETYFVFVFLIFHISSSRSEGVQCGQPGRPVNGTVSPSGKHYFPGEKVTYSCLEGFVLFGEEGRTCLKNGTWSGEVPLCDFNLAKGKRTLQSDTLWSYVPSLAVDGNKDTCSFTPEGPDTRWWQVHLGHKFNVVTIGVTISPGSFQEFTIFVIELLANNKALYKPCTEFKGVFQTHKKLFKCNDGLGHPGQYVYIRDDRKAKEYFGLCEVEVFAYRERIPCGDPEIPTSGAVNREGEDRAIYTCNMGHKLEGDSLLICSSKGEWQGHIPRCKEVTCPPPTHIKNGFIEIGNPRGEYIYGTEAKYNCNPGYVLRGLHVRVCGRDGQWLEGPPTCQVVTCGDPPSFRNTKYKFLNTSTGQWRGIAVYSCEDGFKFHEDNEDTVTTCLDTGTWTPINVSCVPLITKLDFIVHETKGKSIYDIESSSSSRSTPHLVIILAVIAGILAVGMIIFGMLLIRRKFLPSIGSLNPLVSRSNGNCNLGGGACNKTGVQGESSTAVGSMSYLGGYSKPTGLFHSNILQGIANRDYRSRLNYTNRTEDSTSSEGSTTTSDSPYEKVRSEHSYETLRKKSSSKISIGGSSSQDTNYESFSTDRESIGYETVAGPKEPGYEVIANPNDPGYEVVKDKETKTDEIRAEIYSTQKEPGYEVVRSENQDPGYEVLKSEKNHGREIGNAGSSKMDTDIVESVQPDIIKHLSGKDPEVKVKERKIHKRRSSKDVPPEILALYAKVDKTKKNRKQNNPQPPSSPPVPGNHPVLNSKLYKGFSYTVPPGSSKTPLYESKSFRTQSEPKTKDLIIKFNTVNPVEECTVSTSPLTSLSTQECPTSINSQTGSLVRPLPPLPNSS